MKTNFYVAALPLGTHKNVDVTRTKGSSGKIFLKTSNGTVYFHGHGVADLTSMWRFSRADRSAYAKLAGIKLADIERAIKARQAAEDAEDRKSEIARMKKSAAKFGFTVTKNKSATISHP